MSNYVVYHLHSDCSLLDSCTNYKDYIDRAKELEQQAICFTEHSNVYNWIEKKMYCDSNGIKYIHGVECYLTKDLLQITDDNQEPHKVRDNYHTILIARNYDGVKEINRLVDVSTDPEHMYYKPRISFDEFKAISDNVIKISACLASPLSKLRDETLIQYYDYLEIQPHVNSQDQKEYNVWLVQMAKKYGKPLIAGTDTHSINAYKAECRKILLKAKKIEFSGEDEFDLTYKTYDELVAMFEQQGVVDRKDYLEAIENTNKMADSVESFELDKSFKYAKCYDDDEMELKRRVNERYKDKVARGVIKPNPQYAINAREELRVFKKIGMLGFMLFMSDLVSWCWDNGIPIGYCRGSCGGSTIAYLTDIIDVDPIVWNTVFSRFANEDRKELGDIDIDISPTQRHLVYDHIIESFGKDYTAYILAMGTLVDKGTIDEIGRALDYPLDKVAEIKEQYEKDPEEAKKKYKELFYYFDGLLNTCVSQSMHPAGIVVSPVSLPDNYGTFWSDGKRILQINMEECHEVNLNKYDLLGLKNIEIIKDTCAFAGIPYPKSHTLNWEDDAVWKDMLTCPAGIFQFEGSYAFDMLKKFGVSKINDMSLANAALRPSGASYRDRLFNHEINKNPSEIIDDLLRPNYGYLCVEENQKICTPNGLTAIKDIEPGDFVFTSGSPMRVVNKFYNGIKDTYQLDTKHGSIVCTDNHEIYTHVGFVKLSDIMANPSEYSIGFKVGETGNVSLNKNYMKILGWLIGDGQTKQNRGRKNFVNLTHKNIDVVNAFRDAVEAEFSNLSVTIRNIRTRVNLLDLYRANVVSKKRNTSGFNDISKMLIEYGLYDKSSVEKCVPKQLFSADRESILSFLGAYTDTDSSISGLVQYKTISKDLAYGLQEIIRILGYNSSVYVHAKNGYTSYTITVNSCWSYMKELYDYSYKIRKECSFTDRASDSRHCACGRLPRRWVRKCILSHGIGLKCVSRATSINLYDGKGSKKYIEIESVKKICDHFGLSINEFLRDESLSYFPVDKIFKFSTSSRVYDIEVENVHDFVTGGGIIAHNCFQEDTISFLQKICGLTGSEADNIRRAIGRKQKDRLEAALPSILEGYCAKSDKPREIAEQEAKVFLQIIEDSSSYQFGYNHSTGYSMIGYTCAYLRYYYPCEFIAAYLNNANNDDDIRMGTDLAKLKGVSILPPKFRHSRARYVPDAAERNVYKGVASIKYLNEDVAEQLYAMREETFSSFADVIRVFPGNTKQLDILIKLDYFSEFGNIGYLLDLVRCYDEFNGKKQYKKDQMKYPPEVVEIIKNYSDETPKQYRCSDPDAVLHEVLSLVKGHKIPLQSRIEWENEYLGYVSFMMPEQKGIWVVTAIDTKYSPRLNIYELSSGRSETVKISKRDYQENPLVIGDTVRLTIVEKPKMKKVGDEWVQSETEKDKWLKYYTICNIVE